VLLFTKAAQTGDEIWFYDMEHDGYSLDDKRQPVEENDIPDILDCWMNRHSAEFRANRAQRLEVLRAQAVPLRARQRDLEKDIHRLRYESAIARDGDDTPSRNLKVEEQEAGTVGVSLEPLEAEIEQTSRHFWVKQSLIRQNSYDLSASRYRVTEKDPPYMEDPHLTIRRLIELEALISQEARELDAMF
jgi:type I restriction enzyme M protein